NLSFAYLLQVLLVIFLSLLTRYECLYSIHSHRHTYPSMRYAATQICQDESLHLKSGWELFSFCNFSGLLGIFLHTYSVNSPLIHKIVYQEAKLISRLVFISFYISLFI
uniref:Uncharacterized protein n=1 Tax=Cairina moschata TaxID=8855 RepID=A0A8C3CQU9_CAIMO